MSLTRPKRILLVTFLVFVLMSPWLASNVAGSSADLTDFQDSSFVYKKEELIEVKCSPMGDLLSEIVRVKFEVYNNGSSPAQVFIRDRTECIDPDTLTMLYGAPNPTTLERFGNITLITWDGVTIGADSSVEYEYMAETWRSIPIEVNETICVNGNRSDLRQTGKIFTLDANTSDTLTLQTTIRNVGQPLYTGRKKVTPPVLCTVTVMLSNDYFSDLMTSPEANSTSTIMDATMITWMILLNDSVTLNLSAKVKGVSSWGEAPIEPIHIQLGPVPETMVTEIERSIESLEDYIDMLDDFSGMLEDLSEYTDQMAGAMGGFSKALREIGATLRTLSGTLNDALGHIDPANPAYGMVAGVSAQLSALADQLSSTSSGGTGQIRKLAKEMHSTAGDLRNQVNDLKDEKADLEDLLFIVQNQKTPCNIEVYSTTTQHSFEVNFSFEKLRPTRTRRVTKWAVKSIEVTNTGNSTEVVHGLAIQLRGNQTLLKPEYALVSADGEWREFDGNLTQLGLTYDSKNDTLYLWPRMVVNASDCSNILVDWAGRPIQLVVESESEPEVYYVIDVEERCRNVQVEPVESQTTCSVNQPHVIAQNMTFPEYTPPPPPQEDGWTQTLAGGLWLVGSLVLGVVLLVSVIFLRKRRREAEPIEKEFVAEEEMRTEDLLKEIKDLRKLLEDQK